MNEYLTLQGGNLLTLMMPLAFIISKVLFFLKAYIKNSNKIVKIFNYITVLLAIVISIILYVNHCDIYYILISSVLTIISLIQYNLSNRDVEYYYTENPNAFGIVRNITCILWGVFILSIPYTKIFYIIGGGANPTVDLVSKILLHIYGILFIFLDNHTVVFYNRFIRKSYKNIF